MGIAFLVLMLLLPLPVWASSFWGGGVVIGTANTWTATQTFSAANVGSLGTVGGGDGVSGTLQVFPSLGSELAPALTAPNWTIGTGWDSGFTGGLNKNADGTGTATTTAATTIVASTTYRVTITVSALTVGTFTATLGGASVGRYYNAGAPTTYVDYVRTTDTTKLIITPTSTSRFTISAVSVVPLTDVGTTIGDSADVWGNLRVRGVGGIDLTNDGGGGTSGAVTWGSGSNAVGPQARIDMSGGSWRLRVATTPGGTLVESFRSSSSFGVDFASSGTTLPIRFSNNQGLTMKSSGGNNVTSLKIDTNNVMRFSDHTDVTVFGFGPGEAATPSAIAIRAPNASGSGIAGAAFTLAAGLGTGTGNAGTLVFTAALGKATGSTAHTAATIMTIGNTQSAHPGTAGAVVNYPAVTWTDYNTANSGTAAEATAYAFQAPTFASTGTSVTTTAGSTVYIAGAPANGTNNTVTTPYALKVAAGTSYFPANVLTPAPTAEAITAGATITADACGGVKRISSASALTTGTTNTFTAPAASNAGCRMMVCNVNASNAITLDQNANMKLVGGADVVLGAGCCVEVYSTGASGAWFQSTAQLCAS